MQYDEDEWDETIPCPECSREIHEDSVACPGCGHYLSDKDRSINRRPGGWLMLIVIAVIISLLFPLIGNLLNHLMNL